MSGLRLSNLNKETTYLLIYLLSEGGGGAFYSCGDSGFSYV